jgi:putative ABC transport system ATP-binding protein
VQILAALEEQARNGMTVLVVTHNREISRIADRVIELSSGRIVADGPPRDGRASIGDLQW